MLGVVADQRIQRAAAATLEVTFVDSAGEPAAASGAVTVSVVASDDTIILPALTATSAVANRAGVYTVAVTAAQTALLDMLTVSWSDGAAVRATTHVEIVGGVYFTVAEAQASDPSLRDASKYPAYEVRAVRDEVEREFEEILGFALVPRFEVLRAWGAGRASMRVHPYLRSVRWARSYLTGSDSYTALEAAEIARIEASPSGLLWRPDWVAWSGLLEFGYEHGLDRPPSDLKRAALVRLRSRLNATRSGIPDRASRIVLAEGATFSLAAPNATRTGIDEVDAVLARYRIAVPAL